MTIIGAIESLLVMPDCSYRAVSFCLFFNIVCNSTEDVLHKPFLIFIRMIFNATLGKKRMTVGWSLASLQVKGKSIRLGGRSGRRLYHHLFSAKTGKQSGTLALAPSLEKPL